ncbi:DUF881 domain-containing protein [Alicyclobacillus fastidiosus]|uniref:DUF881 domain-containing protein n=1 Tax=Alicyclobacillus fastidiosus TaxID=392011 RepID=A0ABV5AHK2_9BACL|nr:DUF881 domain-containing protein [Alicyclobacillus fastidiosus]WEH08115.1 DUF881 domain-containing protein [Alicyclobacillus fastidiosus]
MNTRTKLTLSLTAVSVVLGLMVSLGYRQTELSARLGSLTSGSLAVNKQLTSKLANLKAANQDAEQQLAAVTAQVNKYEQQSAGSSGTLKELQTKIQDERILAGTTPVHGPGVAVTLNDAGTTGIDVEQGITHDWNVRSVVNELFTAGAEAVTINGVRVVATSAVNCQGPTVTVNDRQLAAPFEVDGIGDPTTLKKALTLSGGILDALRQQGLQVSTPAIKTDIQMPAYTSPLQAGVAK